LRRWTRESLGSRRSPAVSRGSNSRHLVQSFECTRSLHSTNTPKSISISFSNNGKSKSAQKHRGLRHNCVTVSLGKPEEDIYKGYAG
jgi:hypothetical protein